MSFRYAKSKRFVSPRTLALTASGGCAILGAILGSRSIVLAIPCLILAVVLLIKGSRCIHQWLDNSRLLGDGLYRIRTGLGITVHAKVLALVVTWALILSVVIFLAHSSTLQWVSVLLALVVTVVTLKVKTYRPNGFGTPLFTQQRYSQRCNW